MRKLMQIGFTILDLLIVLAFICTLIVTSYVIKDKYHAMERTHILYNNK